MSNVQKAAESAVKTSVKSANVRQSIDYAPVRSLNEYIDTSDDEDIGYVSPSGKPQVSRKPYQTHNSRNSTSQLLPMNSQFDLRNYSSINEPEQQEWSLTRFIEDSALVQGIRDNQGFLLIVLAQVFFAAINCMVRLLQAHKAIPTWEILLVRMSFTWVGCYSYMRWAKVEHPFWGPPGVRLLLVLRGFVGFFGVFSLYYSLQYLSLSDATAISFMSPVVVGVLAIPVLHETYTLLEAFTGVSSIFGVLLIAKPKFLFGDTDSQETGPGGLPVTPEQRELAIMMAILGVFGAACAYLTIRKIGKRANALHSISYFALYSCVVSVIYPFVLDAPPVMLSDKYFLLIFPIGVLGFLAQALLTLGLQLEKAGRGSLAIYTNLLFALMFEYFVFHEFPDFWSMAGALIIVGGAVWVILAKNRIISQTEGTKIPTARQEDVLAEEGLLAQHSDDTLNNNNTNSK